MDKFIVFDIGGTGVKWSIITKTGQIIESNKISIASTKEEFFERIIKTINNMKSKYFVKGVAISAPGAVDTETGIIGGISAIEYIHGPNFKEIIKNGTELDVEIENDANCAALGECWIGAAKEYDDSVFVVCGSGIGGAIIKNKSVHKGHNSHGGEFGYCILEYNPKANDKFKTWSEIGSTTALSKNVAERKNMDKNSLDGEKVFKLFEEKDNIAIEEVEKYFYYMAIGIYNIQYTYDPEIILLGGAISERKDYIEQINKKLDAILEENPFGKVRPLIKQCKMGNDANKIGALYHYLQKKI